LYRQSWLPKEGWFFLLLRIPNPTAMLTKIAMLMSTKASLCSNRANTRPLTLISSAGSDRGWAENTASRLRGWGFNTAGAWSSTELENNTGLLFAVVLDMGVRGNTTGTVFVHFFPSSLALLAATFFCVAWHVHLL
jgi:hypothetical protein